MPTYEYECIECKHKFDVFQSIKDNPIDSCEKCNGSVRKVFGNAAIIFGLTYKNGFIDITDDSDAKNKVTLSDFSIRIGILF